MTHEHHHHHAPGSAPAAPTFSLLGLSAAQRLAAVAVLVVALWGAVLWAIG